MPTIKLKSLLLENIEVVAYHGTDAKFNEFNSKFIGTRTDPGFFGRGFYFINDKDNAMRWGKFVVTAKITLENPLIINGITEFNEKSGFFIPRSYLELSPQKRKIIYAKEINRVTDNLLNMGYDGVIYNRGEGIIQYVTYKPEKQIKIINIELSNNKNK